MTEYDRKTIDVLAMMEPPRGPHATVRPWQLEMTGDLDPECITSEAARALARLFEWMPETDTAIITVGERRFSVRRVYPSDSSETVDALLRTFLSNCPADTTVALKREDHYLRIATNSATGTRRES